MWLFLSGVSAADTYGKSAQQAKILELPQDAIAVAAGDQTDRVGPSQFGQQRAVRFAARDGTALHGYLTLPPDREAKGLPLILWPSGGPGVRAAVGWNPTAQFLATRGYAVLRVNHRGTGGYGREFDAMGKGVSLEGMRTDLLDSIDWAASQGIIAKGRVALYGTDDLRGAVRADARGRYARASTQAVQALLDESRLPTPNN